MGMFGTLSSALKRGVLEAGHTRAREYLLSRDDRFLEDAGFSRELLELGNKAWPWRIEGGLPVTVVSVRDNESAASRERAIADATRELQGLSDNELADLDIARADIADVVRHGRFGHERDTTIREAA